METKHILYGVLAVFVVLAAFQFYQINSLKKSFSGNAITGNAVNGAVDTTGWSENEKMNYEHHGTLPARLQGSASSAPASSGMVGGC